MKNRNYFFCFMCFLAGALIHYTISKNLIKNIHQTDLNSRQTIKINELVEAEGLMCSKLGLPFTGIAFDDHEFLDTFEARTYKSGVVDGWEMKLDKNGNLISFSNYTNGLIDGICVEFHDNGIPMRMEHYELPSWHLRDPTFQYKDGYASGFAVKIDNQMRNIPFTSSTLKLVAEWDRNGSLTIKQAYH